MNLIARARDLLAAVLPKRDSSFSTPGLAYPPDARHTKTAEVVDPTCFACGVALPGSRPEHTVSRPACGLCHSRSRLVEGGALLTEVLRSTRPYPLEGNGLDAVLNPVVINGHRGWASFFGGTFLVLEEVRYSADYFEFCVQHVEPGPSILHAVHAAGLRADVELRSLVDVVLGVPSPRPGLDAFTWLSGAWVTPQVQATVAAHTPIRTNDEAWSAAEARMAVNRSWASMEERAFVSRVVDLASRLHASQV